MRVTNLPSPDDGSGERHIRRSSPLGHGHRLDLHPVLCRPSEDLGVISTSLFRRKDPFGAHGRRNRAPKGARGTARATRNDRRSPYVRTTYGD
ncbi:hypothetical protein FNV65_38895 [Streptomyces sp. S1A1-8]|nr:hypothetical protein FNV61_38925 [Streptomyces sp. RLB3-6]QDO01416.1 hypothetical protein FNV58_40320 [Streptomyces sp. RLB1-9]QDO11603.1 hypothetical protein FNV68_40025 [Streptomyces sp. S1D4-23]QDO23146.1 hypothetical protein FNV65_38895 [Streptomyces sp. S1A1-8]QDO33272.1 hypothetical protein FNV63_38920 [Streptomyces sp. S1A1-3]